MTDRGEYIEIQGTGEESPFSKTELLELLDLGSKGCSKLHEIQKALLCE